MIRDAVSRTILKHDHYEDPFHHKWRWGETWDLVLAEARARYRSGDMVIPEFLTEDGMYSELGGAYLEGLGVEEALKAHNAKLDHLRSPGAKGTVTVYCPFGHNSSEVNAEDPWDECAACGQMMLADNEDDYYSSLQAAGHVS